jgi:small GTP-binding protein
VTARKVLKTKLCLVGEKAVGKTSLIRRFVTDTFDDKYLTTIGTKVSKKEIDLERPEEGLTVHMDMTIWDIMGEKGFRELLKEAYFFGANGILAVADVTRRRTLEELDDWIDGVLKVVGRVPILIAMNKTDLEDMLEVSPAEVDRFAEAFDCPVQYTSAKTGDAVEDAFRTLADMCLAEQLDL